MDAAPRSFAELPRDSDLGVLVPFACGTDDGYGGSGPSVRRLDRRRVTQCALSRICGVCGSGLGRPIAFLGSQLEVDRNGFHFPPAHDDCVRALLDSLADVSVPVLDQDEVVDWVVVSVAGFEYVRPGRDDLDKRARFEPNSFVEA